MRTRCNPKQKCINEESVHLFILGKGKRSDDIPNEETLINSHNDTLEKRGTQWIITTWCFDKPRDSPPRDVLRRKSTVPNYHSMSPMIELIISTPPHIRGQITRQHLVGQSRSSIFKLRLFVPLNLDLGGNCSGSTKRLGPIQRSPWSTTNQWFRCVHSIRRSRRTNKRTTHNMPRIGTNPYKSTDHHYYRYTFTTIHHLILMLT